LNVDPHSDDVLILVVASSKVDSTHRRRAGLPSETVVDILPADYAEFTRPSVVDCNHAFRVTMTELLLKLQSGVATEKAPLPQELLLRLRQGMLASPLVEEGIKQRLK
jgi:hypothetical protein